MTFDIRERLRVALLPPRYLMPAPAGIEISTSGVKAVRLAETSRGIVLAASAEVRFGADVVSAGEIVDAAKASAAIAQAAKRAGIAEAHVALAESKSYLFEADVEGSNKEEWRVAVKQHLDELVPLPPSNTAFDIVPVGRTNAGAMTVVGVGFAGRIVDGMLSALDAAGVTACSLESESFAFARSLLPAGETDTVLLIDIGKTTTKLVIVSRGIPRFTTTIGIGGHALTLAVQKHFGVTELEARRIKVDRGIVPAPGNEDYLAAMLSTVSAVKDEIARNLEYWQGRAALSGHHEPVARAVIAGGNASVRGLPEYLEGALRIPVSLGDVFVNFASRDEWIPPFSYSESLAYATAVGLALRAYL